MNSKYTASHVANYFLSEALEAKVEVTQLKLNKLVYIAQGWYLAIKNEPLFNEKIEAWQHGPVIPSLYHEFKHFRKSPITNRSIAWDDLSSSASHPEVDQDDFDAQVILSKVWEIYKPYSGWGLRQLTHKDGTPWSKNYSEGVLGKEIPTDDIKEYYKEFIKTLLV
ncbi:Panacea domain-containing protein [Thiomicrorhabdus sp. Kp2]|jgi:uncharacterized phage-associated protein|uniref:Panacea domain-containing protein n=1 Tax=Thiomicrorhabdus sp. Kp2 TaxID=1123518 RepID=UPI000424C154|nr:type II toxin-antitoxin system antitoxin SocA domain-containing protein [Thiomicrorhabdus sp. Kp2]